MKKIFSIFMLLLMVTAFSQNQTCSGTKTLSSTFKLDGLSAGSNQDSLLVWSANKKIRYIPTSSINGGTIPNLAKVLQAGQEVSGNGNDVYIDFTNHDNNYTSIFSSFGLTSKNDIGALSIRPNSIVFYHNIGPNSYNVSAQIIENTSHINYASTYRLPDPAQGLYTLPVSVNNNQAAINGDITLSEITTTFTTNDGKTVTVTNGVITWIQ